MTIDLVNFARHAEKRELRWMVGTQFPVWIKDMLRRKASGVDPAALINELAEVCSVDLSTEVLP